MLISGILHAVYATANVSAGWASFDPSVAVVHTVPTGMSRLLSRLSLGRAVMTQGVSVSWAANSRTAPRQVEG